MQFENATHAVAVAVSAIFDRWTALRLTIEHQHGSVDTHAGYRELLDTTIAMATNPSKRHDIDDFTNLFYTTFDRMHTDVEDGSPEEVARIVLHIRDAAARADFEPAMRAAQKSAKSQEALQRSVAGVHDNDADDDDDNCKCMDPSPPPPRQPVVDEDGFTEVVSRRRR